MIVKTFFFALLIFWGSSLHAQDVGSASDLEVFKTFFVNELNSGQLASAEKRATRYVETFRQDAEGWEALGIAKLLRKNYRQAENCFANSLRLARAQNLSNADYLLLHSYALIAMGRLRSGVRKLKEASFRADTKDKAQFLISYVRRNQLPNPIDLYRDSEDSGSIDFIRSVDKKVDKLSASLGLDSGYSSNVLFFSDNLIDLVGRSDSESFYFRPFGSLSYRNENRERAYKLQLQFRSSSYVTEQARQFNDFSPSLSAELKRKTSSTFHWGLQSYSLLNFLNSGGFGYYSGAQNFSLFSDVFLAPHLKTKFSVFIQPQNYSPKTYGSNRDNRSGLGYGASATQYLAFRDQVFSLGFTFTRKESEGVNYRSRSYHVPLEIRWKATDWWSGKISANYLLTNFNQSASARRDHNLSANFSTYFKLLKNLYSGLKYTYVNNRSNLNSYDYQQHEAGALILYEVF